MCYDRHHSESLVITESFTPLEAFLFVLHPPHQDFHHNQPPHQDFHKSRPWWGCGYYLKTPNYSYFAVVKHIAIFCE